MNNGFPDGTSNTTLLVERYKGCDNRPSGISRTHPRYTGVGWIYPAWAPNVWGNATDYDWDTPCYNTFGSTYTPSIFQVAPRPADCDWTTVQTAHTGAMQVALADGSIRGVSGSMSVTTWENARNPADGNPLGSDW